MVVSFRVRQTRCFPLGPRPCSSWRTCRGGLYQLIKGRSSLTPVERGLACGLRIGVIGQSRYVLSLSSQTDRYLSQAKPSQLTSQCQVGSHFHFIETNPQLDFDRIKAYGYHLDIPSGTSARFEPGDTKTVTLTQISGLKTIVGGSSVATGTIDMSHTNTVLRRLKEEGFLHTPEDPPSDRSDIKAYTMDRMAYAMMYGPTVGDTVRLGSSNLRVQVEKDYTAHGDECTFGGGKTLRDGIGQAAGRGDDECADLIIVNALVIDWSGIFKADIGVKDGIISGIGKAGNPDVMDGVNPALIVGSNTDVIAAEGKILTAGGIDTHVHYICPQQAEESLAAGITTMFGGGTGAR